MKFAELHISIKERDQLVMFTGPNCAPCARFKPKMIEAAEGLEIPLHVMSITDNMDAVRGLGIRAVPTVLLMKKDGSTRILFTGETADPRLKLVAAGIPVPGLPAA